MVTGQILSNRIPSPRAQNINNPGHIQFQITTRTILIPGRFDHQSWQDDNIYIMDPKPNFPDTITPEHNPQI